MKESINQATNLLQNQLIS